MLNINKRSIKELSGTKYISSDQHKLSSNSSVGHDNIDINKLIILFKEYNPFSNEKHIRNIVTGVVTNEKVNVDQAGEIGKNLLKLMENQTVTEFHLNQVGNPLTWQQNPKSYLGMKKYLLTQIYYFSVSLQLERTARLVWNIYSNLN